VVQCLRFLAANAAGHGFYPWSGNGRVKKKKKKKEFGDQLNMGKKYMGEKKINP